MYLRVFSCAESKYHVKITVGPSPGPVLVQKYQFWTNFQLIIKLTKEAYSGVFFHAESESGIIFRLSSLFLTKK